MKIFLFIMKNLLNLKDEALVQNRITKDELIALLCIILDVDINKGFNEAIANGHSTRFGPQNRSGYAITENGIMTVEQVDAMSGIKTKTQDDILKIARKIKEVYSSFLRGKKPGTNYYWTESPVLIAKRLNSFFKKYGENFTEDQIVDATKRYLESFNGDYQKTRLLKYFIWKDEAGVGGDIEYSSDLLTYLENKDDDQLFDNMDDLR